MLLNGLLAESKFKLVGPVAAHHARSARSFAEPLARRDSKLRISQLAKPSISSPMSESRE